MRVNDETVEVADQTTVAALLESLGFPYKGRGRGQLGGDSALGLHTTIKNGARVEVVTAVQGG